ncbi:MAG: hypothetical protein KDI01_11000 [Halioglobus sp.]|nr:hypothetical protein [Halioglobus sp.]
MVIFGAAGDLTRRLVVPALYNLVCARRLPDGFRLVGVDLSENSGRGWADGLGATIQQFVTQGGGEFEADHIDNWRWAGVPFYLRTGKYLKSRQTEIAIRFHQAPYSLFRGTDVERMHPNWMILRIQPDEGVALEFAAKRPGPTVQLETVDMDFAYKTWFDMPPNTGYETLIYDCMIGDATLFQRADNIEAGWRAVQPILDAWANRQPEGLPNYVAGSDGPAAADELLVRDGRSWRQLT